MITKIQLDTSSKNFQPGTYEYYLEKVNKKIARNPRLAAGFSRRR